jgi:hypothetical protein
MPCGACHVFWNLLDGGPCRSGPLHVSSESMRGDTLGTNHCHLYVSATTQVISSTLVVERKEPGHIYKVQRLGHYISKVLFNCETLYN